jgi:Kef-type K+ transport system membrane component KefB
MHSAETSLAPRSAALWRSLLLYGVLALGCVATLVLLRGRGDATGATAAPRSLDPALEKNSVLGQLLLALAVVMLTGRLLGRVFVYFQQPPVIGEVVAGILLGPSLLGWLSQSLTGVDLSARLLPATLAPSLGLIAQLGVVLYMFLVGLELNPAVLRTHAHACLAVAHASMAVPFVLGLWLAPALYPNLAPEGVPFLSFALFLGVALSITAFPVLARILADRGMTRAPLGVLALTSAAIGDVTAWCVLAVVVGVVQAQVSSAVTVTLLSFGYVAVMFGLVRPAVGWWTRRYEERPITAGVIAVVLAALLLSALATEAIGIHALFGAFLLGAIIPHDSKLAETLRHRLEEMTTVLLLPAFFAFTGMRTQIGLMETWPQWLVCGAIIALATVGKVGGAYAGARLTGLDHRTSAALGVLMNTRGMMELIVLNIGLDLGVISPTLFTMMVLMALVTTLMTTPLLRRLA